VNLFQVETLTNASFVNHLKGEDRVNLEVTPLYMFLLHDGMELGKILASSH
jgi:hypothetical protein